MSEEAMATQAVVDDLVDAVRNADALITLYWLELLAPSGPAASLSLPSSTSHLTALETAVEPVDLDEPPDVLARLHNAHRLILQVLLLSKADPHSRGLDGSTAAERARARGDKVACALLEEWDRGGTSWTDAETARGTPVREVENWLRREGYDRETRRVKTDYSDDGSGDVEPSEKEEKEPGTLPSSTARPLPSHAVKDSDVEWPPPPRPAPPLEPSPTLAQHQNSNANGNHSNPRKTYPPFPPKFRPVFDYLDHEESRQSSPRTVTASETSEGHRAAALSISSDLTSLPPYFLPSTFWDAHLEAPTPTFSRTLQLDVVFGFLPQSIASHALSSINPAPPMDSDKRAQLVAFLESQVDNTKREHYVAFLKQISGFSARNREFMKMAKKLAGGGVGDGGGKESDVAAPVEVASPAARWKSIVQLDDAEL
ncbi:hypothetical protein RQP46_005727 [Phenoliferia psychrophenolica]